MKKINVNGQSINWVFVAVGILATSLYGISLFFRFDEFTMTPFRESQTAMTAYYLAGQSVFSMPNYQTPVLGAPWQMPFEFPVFQYLVASIASPSAVSIVMIGKLISLVSFIISLGLLYKISKLLLPQLPHLNIMMIMVILSPIHVAYAPSFMMESFTTLLGLMYVYGFLRLRQSGQFMWLVGTCVFGILCVLSKSTSWAGFCLSILVILMLDAWHQKNDLLQGRLNLWARFIVRGLMVGIVPLVVGLFWVHVSDGIKAQNPLSIGLISSNLEHWNYGTLAQKLSPTVWGVILIKQTLLSVGGVWLLIIFTRRRHIRYDQSGYINFAIVCALLFLAQPALFTNLHFRHDYYLMSNGIFLIGATFLIFLKMGLLDRKVVIYCLIGILSISSAGYLVIKKNYYVPADLAAIAVLQAQPNRDPIVLTGYGFSSYIPFFAERRALMVGSVEKFSNDVNYVTKNQAINWAGGITDYKNEENLLDVMALLGQSPTNSFEFYPGYKIYSDRQLVTEFNIPFDHLQPNIDRFEMLLEQTRLEAGSPIHFFVGLFENGAFNPRAEIILKRQNNLFYLNALRPILLRFDNHISL